MFVLFFLLFLCLICSALFSSFETAITAVNRFRLKHKSIQGHKPAIELEILLKDLNRVIALILLGNNFANISAAALATIITLELGGESYVAFSSGILTFVTLIFSEVLPKTFAANHPETIAYPATKVLRVLLFILNPLIYLILKLCSFLNKVLGLDQSNSKGNALHLEELRSMLSANLIQVSSEYEQMLNGILNLNNMKVAHIMRHKNDIMGLDITDSWENIKKKIISTSPHSILLVYENTINNLIGLVPTKSFTVALLKCEGYFDKEHFRKLIEEPVFVQIQINLHQLLLLLQDKKKRMAIVVNEYEEIRGLVTLNDLFHSIVGEIFDDLESMDQIKKQNDGSYIVDASLNIHYFFKIMKIKLPDDLNPVIRTLNGLIAEYLEQLPQKDSTFQYLGYQWHILKVYENRVETVKIFKISNRGS